MIDAHDPAPTEAASQEGGAPVGDLLDETSAPALAVDPSGRVMFATPAAAAILESEAETLAGSLLQDLVPKEWFWAVRNALLRVASGSTAAFELLLVGRQGRRTLVQMIPRPWQAASLARGYLLVCVEQGHAGEQPPRTVAETRLRRLAYELLRSHDLERGRFAAELHEDIAPLVIMAKMMTEVAAAQLARGAYSEAAAVLANATGRLRETLAAVSRVSNELEPRSLGDLGLLPTIEWYCRAIGDLHPGLRIVVDLSAGEGAVAPDLRLDLFRVVEQALLNVGQHAQATEVRVALFRDGSHLRLLVQDDGAGFDVGPFLQGETSARGLGLHSMRKRVAATGGALHVHSAPWQGTTIGASWPLAAAAQIS
jgi:two-component system NarL family sensor kinase